MIFTYFVSAVFTTASGEAVARLTNASQSLFIKTGFRPKVGDMLTLLFDNGVPTVEYPIMQGRI